MSSEGAGRVAVVTGGSRGIGRAIAEALAARGDRVAVLSRSGEGPPGVLALAADVTDTASVDAAFTRVEDELGRATILVSNAGVTEDGLLATMAEDQFSRVVDANLGGAYRVARRAVRGMLRERAGGRIVLVGSVVALTGSAGQVNYAASKAGLIGLARSLARELAARAITVNVVAPGPVATDMLVGVTEARAAQVAAAVPLGRVGEPAEVAAAVAYLTGEAAGFVTGAVLPVDGGMGMGH